MFSSTANLATITKFVENFFTVKETCEVPRKSFLRFSESMPQGMDEQTIKAAYEKFTGKTPTYKMEGSPLSPVVIDRLKEKTFAMINNLGSDPKSFSDLYKETDKLGRLMGAPTNYTTNLIRECFKKMSKEGLVGVIEVKTCNRVAIRLYYAR